MATRRHGDKNQFWDAVAVLANGVSTAVDVGRGAEQITFWIQVSAATTVSIEVAHSGDLTAEGIFPEGMDATTWAQLYYLNTPIQIQFTAAGYAAVVVPDFEPQFVRLRSSAAATITAGWEVSAD